jgi:peptidoglycan/xylan/chitin deacetylase (PgdA/CDA1 family)
MTNLWSSNSPARFWLCQEEIPDDEWRTAIDRALPELALPDKPVDVDDLLAMVLGEGQFGSQHWQLSTAGRLYYLMKPLLPRRFRHLIQRLRSPAVRTDFRLSWPTEERYARFQWEVMRQLLLVTNKPHLTFRSFWPAGREFAFVITHDVETERGHAFVQAVADLDESHGFRSSFYFVPERYPLDQGLLEDLRERGFEIGIHGLRHDGKLFSSHTELMRRAERINGYLKDLDAVGFRSPLMMRHPEWLQELEIEYDLSFFDTDPFQPVPGGTMSIWPFMLGRFVELPYTLTQDCVLTTILGETSPQLWLDKLNFIERYRGMALVNTHPDYLRDSTTWQIYDDLLRSVKERRGYWHALPREIARWWRARSQAVDGASVPGMTWDRLELDGESLHSTLMSTNNAGIFPAADAMLQLKGRS